MAKDILLDNNGELLIRNGDFVIGESEMQEVGLLLELNQGGLKEDPILGPNLVTVIRGSQKEERVKRSVKTHLARDNKDYESIKNKIKLG